MTALLLWLDAQRFKMWVAYFVGKVVVMWWVGCFDVWMGR